MFGRVPSGERRKVGVVIGTGMHDFLKEYAIGEWKDEEFEVQGKKYKTTIFLGSIHYDENELNGNIQGYVPIVGVYRHMDPNNPRVPNQIDYTANMLALYKNGARNVIATSAVGAAYQEYMNGFVIPTELMDRTPRVVSVPTECGEIHAGMGEPFDPQIIKLIEKVASEYDIKIFSNAEQFKIKEMKKYYGKDTDMFKQTTKRIYYCQTNGSEFETRGDTVEFASKGADIFGMTAGTEAKNCAFIGIPVGVGEDRKVLEKMRYAVICLPTNLCAHKTEKITHEAHAARVRAMSGNLGKLMKGSINAVYVSDLNVAESLLL